MTIPRWPVWRYARKKQTVNPFHAAKVSLFGHISASRWKIRIIYHEKSAGGAGKINLPNKKSNLQANENQLPEIDFFVRLRLISYIAEWDISLFNRKL